MTKALKAYITTNLPLLPPETLPESYGERVQEAYSHVLGGQSVDGSGPPGDREAKVKMHLRTAQSAVHALGGSDDALDASVMQACGVLYPFIDLKEKHTVQGTDHRIFTDLTKRYEQRFFDDMKTLNVRYPDKLTRVTEYGLQIANFVKQIEQNKFAYEHNGSVYFDIGAWESTGGVYARLEPWNRNDRGRQIDGEGALSNKKTDFKKTKADFALWKASVEGEPSWDSPWGQGRPGWHIECSAMASDVLGKQFDVHSGGIDLAFPHHDNELVQSEAYWHQRGSDSEQWVNYFLHMGHLSIQGSKMSKSLKNFTTIKDAIAQGAWTPRGLRVVFLLSNWRDGLEITEKVVKAGKAWEEKVDNLFLNVRDVQQRAAHQPCSETRTLSNDFSSLLVSSGQDSDSLLSTLEESKSAFHDAILDSFDTPTAMRTISDLITAYNSTRIRDIPIATSVAIGGWITTMVDMFGLDAKADQREDGIIGWSGLKIADEARPFVYLLSALRDAVREQAKAKNVDVKISVDTDIVADARYLDNVREEIRQQSSAGAAIAVAIPSLGGHTSVYAQILQSYVDQIRSLTNSEKPKPIDYLTASDWVRDTALWDQGIYLEDRDSLSLPALVRPLSESLRDEREQRRTDLESKKAAKAKQVEAAAAKQAELDERARLSHHDMFKTDEFGAWDAEGLPTHDKEGSELAKSRVKKLKKDFERQKRLHEEWVARQSERT